MKYGSGSQEKWNGRLKRSTKSPPRSTKRREKRGEGEGGAGGVPNQREIPPHPPSPNIHPRSSQMLPTPVTTTQVKEQWLWSRSSSPGSKPSPVHPQIRTTSGGTEVWGWVGGEGGQGGTGVGSKWQGGGPRCR